MCSVAGHLHDSSVATEPNESIEVINQQNNLYLPSFLKGQSFILSHPACVNNLNS